MGFKKLIEKKQILIISSFVILCSLATALINNHDRDVNAAKDLITDEYKKGNITIAAIIGDTISTTFPITGDYVTSVECTTNGGPSNATGTATWNGTKWVLNVSGVDAGKTICNVYFKDAPDNWNDSPEGTLLNALKTNNTISAPVTIPGRQASRSDEAVLAQSTDDYGMTYYFRGSVQNNYVVFAGMCWRMVRITGSGAIKLILYNENPSSVNNPCASSQDGASLAFARHNGSAYATSFSQDYIANAYIGFMRGTAGSTSYANEHSNINKSIILQRLEAWYSIKLTSYGDYLADIIWCNDKQIDKINVHGTTLGYALNKTGYSARTRIYGNGSPSANASPSFLCPNDSNGGKLSKYTVNDTVNGNGNLTYKIGLITADEAAFAGSVYAVGNSTYYLYKNATEAYWWTMTPMMFDSNNAYNYMVGVGGMLNYSYVVASLALRPTIALVPTVTVIGGGTSTNPYVVTSFSS